MVGREAGVLGQDAGLQGDQLRARVEPQLLTERPTRRADRAEGVCLAATAVLRQSQQRPPALAERLLTGEHRAVGRDACVVTAVEPRLQQILFGGQPQLAEADGLEASRHPVLQLPEGRTSPQGEASVSSGIARSGVRVARYPRARSTSSSNCCRSMSSSS